MLVATALVIAAAAAAAAPLIARANARKVARDAADYATRTDN